jgi:signal transduction histidine kinase
LTLRQHLMLMALGAALPVLLFAAVLASVLVAQDRATFDQGNLGRARALSTAVDAELQGTVRALVSIASSEALQRDDLKAFHEQAVRALVSQPDWINVNLVSPGRQQLVNARLPFGAALPAVSDPAFQAVVERQQPTIADISPGPVSGEPGVPVRVPVVRGGKVVYVLSAVLRASSIGDALKAQGLPPGWVAAVADRSAHFVARSPAAAPGSAISPGWTQALKSAREGSFRANTVEGVDTYQWYATSGYSGWSVGLAIPATVVQALAWRTTWVTALAALLALALAALAATLLGRRIERPVASLATAADAIAAGSEPPPSVARIAEVAAVAASLERAAAAVQAREREQKRAEERLRATNDAKDEFLATLSHELRNPLASISMSASLLKRTPPSPEVIERTAAVLQRQSRQMARLVEDLLDVSRITLGRIELRRRRFDLSQNAARLVSTWRESGRLARHTVVYHGEAAWVDADPSRIEQVMANVLDNSVKFTPEGGRIEVKVERQAEWAVFTVNDTGRGLAPGLAGHMFEVFHQGEQSLDRPSGGLGVGLALVKRLVELHGGRVEATSPGPGRGTLCRVSLTAVEAPATLAAPTRSVRPLAPQRVLIVEDNEDARSILELALRQEGHEVQSVADGPSALAACAAGLPRFVILDIGLPGMDGYEVARELRARYGGALTLVALSGYGQPSDRARGEQSGVDEWITKPVDLAALLSLLEQTLRAA